LTNRRTLGIGNDAHFGMVEDYRRFRPAFDEVRKLHQTAAGDANSK